MRGLTARDLLDLSDEGRSLDRTSRALLLAAWAAPDAPAEECASLPVGARDRLVLALRMHTFGSDMTVRFRCPDCGSDLTARVDLRAILSAHGAGPPSTVRVEIDGEIVDARLPDSEDLFATAGLPAADAEWALYERCVLSKPGCAPAVARQAVAEAILLADPLAAFEVELDCGECHRQSTEPFDVVSCFWKEIEAGASSAALEVHALASAYGWSEDQILSMSPARRARYRAFEDR